MAKIKPVVPADITKIERSQFLTYLDTTPVGTQNTWSLFGVGVTDYSIDYNAQVDTEKWIVEDNSRIDHSSNQKQSSISQSCYKGDPCFEFIAKGRDKLNYKTNILDIDTWNATEDGKCPAKKSSGKIVVTKWMGEKATIEADVHYEGDPIEGTVTFDSSGVPTFTPGTTASL